MSSSQDGSHIPKSGAVCRRPEHRVSPDSQLGLHCWGMRAFGTGVGDKTQLFLLPSEPITVGLRQQRATIKVIVYSRRKEEIKPGK